MGDFNSATQLPWLEAGYAAFAQAGPAGLKVEVLARQVGKSKSSFYHLFAELEIFTAALLGLHLDRVRALAEQERQCPRLDPELLDLLLASKADLLFHRQLRIARATEPFAACLRQTEVYSAEALLRLWSEIIGLPGRPHVSQQLYELAVEHFYLRLSEADFSRAWLLGCFTQVRQLVTGLQHPEKPAASLDGTV